MTWEGKQYIHPLASLKQRSESTKKETHREELSEEKDKQERIFAHIGECVWCVHMCARQRLHSMRDPSNRGQGVGNTRGSL